jgi:DNA polymerase-3 subunit gamma/tau
LLSVTGKNRQALAQQAQKLSSDTILAGLDVLATAKTRLRGTSHGRVVLEIALVRLCNLENLVSLSQLAQTFANGAAVSGVPAAAPRVGNTAAVAPEKKKVEDEPAASVETVELRPENLGAIRQQLVTKAGLTIGNELRRVISLAISAPNTLVFQVPSRYNLRDDQVFEGKRRAEIEELTTAVVGQPCQVRVEIVADPAHGQTATAAIAPDEAPHVKARRQRAEVMQMPLVAKAAAVLGAQIVGVDDDFGKELPATAGPLADLPEEE